MTLDIKICGLRTEEAVDKAVALGASHIGFIFFPKSPRNIEPSDAGRLAERARGRAKIVAVTVNADSDTLDEIVDQLSPDMIQLHGSESPARVTEVRALTGLPVMKAVGVAEPGDLERVLDYSLVADQILVDAKPPKGADLPGGNGISFDWRLVAQRRWLRPWMLAGGLTAGNVAEAIRLTNARQVDVSSGVESEPGVKDAAKIAAFCDAARSEKGGVPILR